MSKHGGSPFSGLAGVPGVESLQPAQPGGLVVAPEMTKRRLAALERERQFERRRVALEVLPSVIERFTGGGTGTEVDVALGLADELIAKTPVPEREVRDE